MDREITRKEIDHDVGLALIKSLAGQNPNDDQLRTLSGEEASRFISVYIKDVFGWSGVTIEEARIALSETSGKFLKEVNRAIDIIQEEEQKKLQEKQSGGET